MTLLCSGNPTVAQDFHGLVEHGWRESINDRLPSFEAPYLGTADGHVWLTDPDFIPLLNFELPVVEVASLNTLHRLMGDYPEELCSFRDFLRDNMAELKSTAIGSTEFTSGCRRIERRIRDQIRKFAEDVKKTKLKSAFSLTGCAVAAWTLTVYCLLVGNNVLTVLGPGGLAYKLANAYRDYLIDKLEVKGNPVYFLWVLGNTRRI